MRDKDTSAVREMFQYSSLAEKPFDQWEIATHWRPHHCDPHLDQTKFNDLLPLTIDGVLSGTNHAMVSMVEKQPLVPILGQLVLEKDPLDSYGLDFFLMLGAMHPVHTLLRAWIWWFITKRVNQDAYQKCDLTWKRVKASSIHLTRGDLF